MKQCIIIIIIISGLIPYFGFAQTENNIPKTNDYINSYASDEVKFNETIKNVGYKDFQGSPYLTDSFTVGSIYTYKNEQFQNIPIRYNIYTDNIEYIMGASRVLELKNPESVEKVELQNCKLVYLQASGIKNQAQGFFIVLTEGKATLLSKPRVTLQKPTPQGAYNDSQPPGFLRHTDTYYLKTADNICLLSNRKKLIQSFPEHRKQVADYIKANHVKVTDSKNLTELVKYYNSLQDNTDIP